MFHQPGALCPQFFLSSHAGLFFRLNTLLLCLRKPARDIFKLVTPQFSSVQSLSHVLLFATPWTAARQASLSIINSQSLLKQMDMSPLSQ